MKRQTDEITGLTNITVMDPSERSSAGKELRPAITLVDDKGKEFNLPGTNVPAHYFLPSKAIVGVENGVDVNAPS